MQYHIVDLVSKYLMFFNIIVTIVSGYDFNTTPYPESKDSLEIEKSLQKYFSYPIYEDGKSINGEDLPDIRVEHMQVEKLRIAPITYMIFKKNPIINLQEMSLYIEDAYFANFIQIQGEYKFFLNREENELKGTFFSALINMKVNATVILSLGEYNNLEVHVNKTSLRWDKPTIKKLQHLVFHPILEEELITPIKLTFSRRFKELLNDRFKNNSTSIAHRFFRAISKSKNHERILKSNRIKFNNAQSELPTTIEPMRSSLLKEMQSNTTESEAMTLKETIPSSEAPQTDKINFNKSQFEATTTIETMNSSEIFPIGELQYNNTQFEAETTNEQMYSTEIPPSEEIQSNKAQVEAMTVKESTDSPEIAKEIQTDKTSSEGKHIIKKKSLYSSEISQSEEMQSNYEYSLSQNTEMFNELVDRIMISVRQNIKDREKELINLPKIEKIFTKKLGLLPIMGKFQASHGSFKNLSSIKRTSDVEIEPLDQAFRIKSAFGLEKAELLYQLYELHLWNLHLKGYFRGNVNKNSASSSIIIDYSQSPCRFILDEFHLEDFSQIRVEISGYGSYNGLASILGTWVLNHFNSKVVKNLDAIFSEALRKQLKLIQCKFN